MQQIDDLKEGIKETVNDLSGTSGIDKKMIKKLASTMYKHNYASYQEENRHFETLYETLIEGRLTVVDPVEDEQEAA